MPRMTSPHKIAFHRDKLDAFLRQERVFPASIELDITTRCPRACHECPSTLRSDAQSLDLPFLDRLFSLLEGQSRGLLISGGEPTISPIFPEVLSLARRKGIEQIAIVTNGYYLHHERVADALAEHAAAVRISFYDWEEELQGKQGGLLKRIEFLRNRLERQSSPLHIGVSALTTRSRIPQFRKVAMAMAAAGAHWLYFHPMCAGWGTGQLSHEDQEGVVQALVSLQQEMRPDFGIHYCPQRYETSPLTFDEYYAAHFLLVIGADGKNYLGTEVKYHPQYVLADLSGGNWRDDFLWQAGRLERTRAFNHRNYPPLGGRHRAVLYNHYVQQVLDGSRQLDADAARPDAFLFPHVL
jgi:MoaA/NifB/PqqE/SkfB family radical SAM enzyme